MSVQQVQQATAHDEHLQHVKGFITAGWPESKEQIHQDFRTYWSFRDDMAVTNGIIMKGRCVVIPEVLKQQTLDQLHVNHSGIEKTKLLAPDSTYWANINNDIKKFIQNCTTCLTFQQTQPKEKIICHYIQVRPWDVISADMFTLNNKQYLCIVDYHSKFLNIKKMEDLSADSLILVCKIIFAEYGVPKIIM